MNTRQEIYSYGERCHFEMVNSLPKHGSRERGLILLCNRLTGSNAAKSSLCQSTLNLSDIHNFDNFFQCNQIIALFYS